MYDKNSIDREAEREAMALKKQGRRSNFNDYRQNIDNRTHSQDKFNRLFKGR